MIFFKPIYRNLYQVSNHRMIFVVIKYFIMILIFIKANISIHYDRFYHTLSRAIWYILRISIIEIHLSSISESLWTQKTYKQISEWHKIFPWTTRKSLLIYRKKIKGTYHSKNSVKTLKILRKMYPTKMNVPYINFKL